jgi:hypothetical protein
MKTAYIFFNRYVDDPNEPFFLKNIADNINRFLLTKAFILRSESPLILAKQNNIFQTNVKNIIKKDQEDFKLIIMLGTQRSLSLLQQKQSFYAQEYELILKDLKSEKTVVIPIYLEATPEQCWDNKLLALLKKKTISPIKYNGLYEQLETELDKIINFYEPPKIEDVGSVALMLRRLGVTLASSKSPSAAIYAKGAISMINEYEHILNNYYICVDHTNEQSQVLGKMLAEELLQQDIRLVDMSQADVIIYINNIKKSNPAFENELVELSKIKQSKKAQIVPILQNETMEELPLFLKDLSPFSESTDDIQTFVTELIKFDPESDSKHAYSSFGF